VFKVWDERRVGGRVFQTVGAAIWNEREPKWRLVRGTDKSAEVDETLTAALLACLLYRGLIIARCFSQRQQWQSSQELFVLWSSMTPHGRDVIPCMSAPEASPHKRQQNTASISTETLTAALLACYNRQFVFFQPLGRYYCWRQKSRIEQLRGCPPESLQKML